MNGPTPSWVLEPDVFGDHYAGLVEAVHASGARVEFWNDDWWRSGAFPNLEEPVVFHGSLGNADRIRRELPWSPGAFCATAAFHCRAWYERAGPLLASRAWRPSTVRELSAAPEQVAGALAVDGRVFVRPDSPLKPFSGRLCTLDGLTPQHLDHGFYYDDPALPIIVAEPVTIGREWRFVIVDERVVASSGYVAEGRTSTISANSDALAFARDVAARFAAPEPVYVLDVGELPEAGPGELRIIEINPFSGADLYACDPAAVIGAVHDHLAAAASAPGSR